MPKRDLKVYSSNTLPLVRLTSSQTKRHCLKIQKRETAEQISEHFFGFRIANVWNSLTMWYCLYHWTVFKDWLPLGELAICRFLNWFSLLMIIDYLKRFISSKANNGLYLDCTLMMKIDFRFLFNYMKSAKLTNLLSQTIIWNLYRHD